LVAASEYRGEITIQHYAGGEVYVGFGEAPTVGQGLRISETFPVLKIDDHRAMLEIHLKCDTGVTANGGYQTT
jgi:hypothetical protein